MKVMAEQWGSGPDGNGGAKSVPTDGVPRDAAIVNLMGLRFQDLPLEDVAASIVRDAKAGVHRQVFFVNAHCVNVAARDQEYRQILQKAGLVYADGAGMELAARINGTTLTHNVNGTDLFPLLCAAAAREGVPIALLGAKPGYAAQCADNMRMQFPGLQIPWVEHGYLPADEERGRIEELGKSGVRILLVAKGVPMQEHWISRHADDVGVPVLLGVGALFDFYSGNMPRAPSIMRKLKLEWLFRLSMEPRRMFSRYVLGNPEFLVRAFRWRANR